MWQETHLLPTLSAGWCVCSEGLPTLSAWQGTHASRMTMHAVDPIAASGFGGYQEILSIHAEGSLAVQRITILRDYDVKRCVEIAMTYLKD